MFLPGASDLADLQRARCFDTMLIAGLLTNAYAESSAHDAMVLIFSYRHDERCERCDNVAADVAVDSTRCWAM